MPDFSSAAGWSSCLDLAWIVDRTCFVTTTGGGLSFRTFGVYFSIRSSLVKNFQLFQFFKYYIFVNMYLLFPSITLMGLTRTILEDYSAYQFQTVPPLALFGTV